MHPLLTSIRCSRVFVILVFLSAFLTGLDAEAFCRAPLRLGEPAVRALGIQGNNVYLQYWNIPWMLHKGRRAGDWEVVLEASNPRTFKMVHTGVKIGQGSGVLVVRIPPNVAPDTYRVLVYNNITNQASAGSQRFPFVPLLDTEDTSRLVFDNGIGKNLADSKTTYREVRNTWKITVRKDVGIGFVVPGLWGCTGQCLLDVRFFDSRGNGLGGFLGADIRPVGGTLGTAVMLKKKIELRAGDTIRVEMKLVSTGAAGMHSTGPLNRPQQSGVFQHELIGTSQPSRGGMSFQLYDVR